MGGRIQFGAFNDVGFVPTPPPAPDASSNKLSIELPKNAGAALKLIDPHEKKGGLPIGPTAKNRALMLQQGSDGAALKKKETTAVELAAKERKEALADFRAGRINEEQLKTRLGDIGLVREPADAIWSRLALRVGEIRGEYLPGKPPGKANVAALEVHVEGGDVFRSGATSRAKSPAPLPPAKSQGGQFEPTLDSHSGRVMDTDAEYKALSEAAAQLEAQGLKDARGKVFLHTELYPCESCLDIVRQFREKFPNMKVEVSWDLPYPSDGAHK